MEEIDTGVWSVFYYRQLIGRFDERNLELFGTMGTTPKERLADHLAALPRVKGLDQLRPVIREKLTGEVPGWEQARVLTDDQAPVEMAWELMAFEYVQ